MNPLPSAQPAPSPADDFDAAALELAPYYTLLLCAAGGVAGLLASAWLQPAWLTGLWTSLSGAAPTAFWYLSRASALVGFGLLWLSMVLGLVLSNKLTRIWPGGPTFNALHEQTSLLGLAFGLFHALILLADPYFNYSLGQVLTPFASGDYRPVWIGLGQIALYLLIPVTLTFYVRRWIGARAWRLIHYLSFAVFALVAAHGLWSGTDSASPAVFGLYWLSAASVIGLTAYRVLSRPATRVAAA